MGFLASAHPTLNKPNSAEIQARPAMPKLYEYFGLIVMFYANEHEPVHVHGKCQGREAKAEIILVVL